MLIRLIVENFLSFEKRTELTLIPSKNIEALEQHKISANDVSLLQYAVIYGANAAGKSNLVEAFHFIKYCIIKNIPIEASYKFCKNKKANEKRNSEFEIQFTVNGRFFAYGFHILMKERKIIDEWLYELYQGEKRPKQIFYWKQGEKPIIDSRLEKTDTARFKTYINDFDENANVLFLNVMNWPKKFNRDKPIYIFKEVYDWFANCLTVVTPNTVLKSFEYYYDVNSISLIKNLINFFDTGITDIKIEKTTLEAVRKEVPDFIFNDITKEIRRLTEISRLAEVKFSVRSQRNFYNFVLQAGKAPQVTTILLEHGNAYYNFKYGEESDGTRRLFELLDILLNTKEDSVYVVDEIERSLHPKLTEKFIEVFNKRHVGSKMQLVFTTHESAIMDLNLFRKDEVWFVERENDNSSKVYSLDTFKDRYDNQLRKEYLAGRYGAIPVFSSFTFKKEE